MIKPIIIPTDKCENGLIMVRGNLEYHNKYLTQDYLGSIPAVSYDIILIDTEAEIVEDDPMLFEDIRAERHFNWKDSSECNKIVAMSYKHKIMDTIPQLSPQSIRLLINYYNEHKCMPESVESSTINKGSSYYSIIHNSVFMCEHEAQLFDENEIKLNEQGEIDITIPEVEVIGKPMEDYIRAKHTQEECVGFIDGGECS